MKDTIEALREAQDAAEEALRIKRVASQLRDEALAEAIRLKASLPKAMIVPAFAVMVLNNLSPTFHRDRLVTRVTEPDYNPDTEGYFL